jgi:hypothetical protein
MKVQDKLQRQIYQTVVEVAEEKKFDLVLGSVDISLLNRYFPRFLGGGR